MWEISMSAKNWARIPTAQDWLLQIKPQRWMYGQRLETKTDRCRRLSMTGPNGHAYENGGTTSGPPAAASVIPMVAQFSPERVKELVAALEVPFDASQI